MHIPEIETMLNVREVLGSILDQNRGKWQRFIAAVLKNDADAEDVVHNAVRRVLVRDMPFSSEEQVRMYLGRAIGNAAFERYKGMKRERLRQMAMDEQVLMSAESTNPHDSMEEAERCIERERLLGLVRQGLEHLPSKQYEALRLTILESRGSSIRDAGMNNGIPYSTLRHRSKQGLRSLRRYLQSGGKQELEVRRQKSGDRIQNDFRRGRLGY
jgi:RNA polymerase sigma-70 factor, ECF subfamily